MDSERQIRIRGQFSEKYTLDIVSDIKAVNTLMKSKTRIRWDFSVLDVNEDSVQIKLILLDHILLESNNPIIKEIANLTKAFSRLYNELHLRIDHTGKIVDVLNMDIIMSKWQQTKKEMQEIADSDPSIKNAILLNDTIFRIRLS